MLFRASQTELVGHSFLFLLVLVDRLLNELRYFRLLDFNDLARYDIPRIFVRNRFLYYSRRVLILDFE